jgi:type IV secretory pathway TrbD component
VGAAALFWYGAFLGLLLWIVAVCVVAIAGEKLSAKAPETLTLLG